MTHSSEMKVFLNIDGNLLVVSPFFDKIEAILYLLAWILRQKNRDDEILRYIYCPSTTRVGCCLGRNMHPKFLVHRVTCPCWKRGLLSVPWRFPQYRWPEESDAQQESEIY